MGSKKIDLTGRKFGRLTVLSEAGRSKCGKITWLCGCECGTQKVIRGAELRSGDTRSCGCLQRELVSLGNGHRTHGMKRTATYKTWSSIKERCCSQKNISYKNYGERGITICDRWKDSFENFYSDMGERPKGLTIDRIDNNKEYSPDNCRWATLKEQNRNKRNNRVISYQGKAKCISAWAEELGINYGTLLSRLNRHTPQIAFNM